MYNLYIHIKTNIPSSSLNKVVSPLLGSSEVRSIQYKEHKFIILSYNCTTITVKIIKIS